MANGNGRSDAPDETDELPPGLSAWFAIEECVGETLDALRPSVVRPSRRSPWSRRCTRR